MAKLSVEEINQIIGETLSVDAFTDQRSGRPVLYKGKNLAEYLERVLFICPRCRKFVSLHSHGDDLSCSCGLHTRFNAYGFFEPVDSWSQEQVVRGSFLESVAAWDDWQRQTLISQAEKAEQAVTTGQSDELPAGQAAELSAGPAEAAAQGPDHLDWSGKQAIFRDHSQKIYDCQRAKRSVLLDEGTLALYADRLEFIGPRFRQVSPLSEIARLIVFGPQTLQFNTKDGQILEVRSKTPRSAYKYLLLHRLLEQKRKGEPHGFFGI
jgi:hypothetical protein